MTKFLRPTEDGFNSIYTKGRLYRVEKECENYRYAIKNNLGELQACRADGNPSARLRGDGIFEVVTSDMIREDPRNYYVGLSLNDCNEATNQTGELGKLIAEARREAEQHKQELLKAEALIDKLYDMFAGARNHDQLLAAIKRSKIFSDAFLEMQHK